MVAAVLALAAPAVAFTVGGKHVDRWPYSKLQLGVLSLPGSAQADHKLAPFGFRYAYLSGGVNTGDDWRKWADGNGDYVSKYISESEKSRAVPVFSYYELRQSEPGVNDTSESESEVDLGNLDNRKTMRAYYLDLKDFFKQAASAKAPVVLQVEPDLWGYIEVAAGANAANVKASVASSGMPDLHGLKNNAAGFAQAILVLRNNYAPHVIVAYHDSIWGTGKAIQASHPTTAQVTQMAATSVHFYRSLHAKFNAIFAETSDRDAAYAKLVTHETTSQWWKPIDFAHLGEYVKAVHKAIERPIVIWQIPVGNTIMRAMNNTKYHYQDNNVQTLLAQTKKSRALLHSYARDGVSALLFGSGQATDTCACDNDHNRLSHEPKPIDGNTHRSYSDADDGGYFMHVAKLYYRHGDLKVG